jgi:sulfite reductase beta subunit
MSQPQMRKPIECGVPDNKQYLHPTLLKNYGNWKYHDRPRPGVLHHVSHSGDEVWTVRAGTQRQMDVYTIRKLCDIADKFAEAMSASPSAATSSSWSPTRRRSPR